MMPNVRRTLRSSTIIALAITSFAPVAVAANLKSATVTACSTNGRHGCYTAPVRQTPLGPQMRLKHGTWIWCEGDCRDTLRRATIDFWDDQRDRGR